MDNASEASDLLATVPRTDGPGLEVHVLEHLLLCWTFPTYPELSDVMFDSDIVAGLQVTNFDHDERDLVVKLCWM